MKRISITELDLYQICRMKHHYRYAEKLRIPVDSPALTIGINFADAIEKALLVEKSKDRLRTALEDVSIGSTLYKVLKGVPQWLWELERPVSEDKLEVVYRRWFPEKSTVARWTPNAEGLLQIVGKLDAWHVMKDGDEVIGVVVYEFKTSPCSNKELGRKLEAYEHWGIQPQRYAVLINDSYDWVREVPVYRQHILINHNGQCAEGNTVIVPDWRLDQVREEMCLLANEVGTTPPFHTFSALCGWCEYKELCMAWITGGDEAEVVEERGEHEKV